VDVELVRPDFGGDEIAERYFAPQEVEELRILPPSLRAEGFFLCWTRKEAYVKPKLCTQFDLSGCAVSFGCHDLFLSFRWMVSLCVLPMV
jgi:4'-phosphopantetheinyl transferase superfamily